MALDLKNTNILEEQDIDTFADPSKNYETLEDLINTAKTKNIKKKIVKFNKYLPGQTKWITSGIICSMKYKDKLYKSFKSTPLTSPLYNTKKINLSTYINILRSSIKLAKICIIDRFSINIKQI